MNILDIVIGAIITLFVVIGVLRGFLGEVLSFLTWALSLTVAWLFSGAFSGWFAGHVKDANLRAVVVFFALFFASFIILTILSHFLRTLWSKVGSQGVDRTLGGMVGFVKGAGIVLILVLLAGLTPFPKDPAWRSSLFVRYFQVVAVRVVGLLPSDVARNVRYD